MKNINKQNLIKKIKTLQKLDNTVKSLLEDFHNMGKELEQEEKILENKQTKYLELLDTSIENIKNYSDIELDEIISVLKTSPKRIEKLKKKRSKVFRQYQLTGDKIHKLRTSSR